MYCAALIIWNFNPFYAFINAFSDLIVASFRWAHLPVLCLSVLLEDSLAVFAWFSDTDHIFIVLFTWILSGELFAHTYLCNIFIYCR